MSIKNTKIKFIPIIALFMYTIFNVSDSRKRLRCRSMFGGTFDSVDYCVIDSCDSCHNPHQILCTREMLHVLCLLWTLGW